MEINKINSPNSVQGNSNVNSNKKLQSSDAVSASKRDKIELSDSAKTQALYKKAFEVAKAAPEIRTEAVEEAKKLLESLKNPSDQILEEVSRKVLRDFGIS